MLSEKDLHRRVAGHHDHRMDGLLDIVVRAPGAAVMDIGCNRGLVAYEMMKNGATICHGCDNYPEGIQVARHVFADLRNCQSQFEVVDLSQGYTALAPFHGASYDIMLCLAIIHKIKRVMPADKLSGLIQHLGKRTRHFFCWRATSEKFAENEAEMAMIDRELAMVEMRRIHTSYISHTLGVSAIWARGY